MMCYSLCLYKGIIYLLIAQTIGSLASKLDTHGEARNDTGSHDWDPDVDPDLDVEGDSSAIDGDSADFSNKSNQSVSERAPYIFNGNEVRPHGYPWMAQISARHGGASFCTGSVISSRFILTAGHCTSNNYFVRVGDNGFRDHSHAQVRTASKHRHPQYSQFLNDIALLELHQPLNLNNYVSPIWLPDMRPPPGGGRQPYALQLPSWMTGMKFPFNKVRRGPQRRTNPIQRKPSFVANNRVVGGQNIYRGRGQLPAQRPAQGPVNTGGGMRPQIGETMTVSGWGSTAYGVPHTLMETTIPVRTGETCARQYGMYVDNNRMICAGYNAPGRSTTCPGDSGGPLMTVNNGKWVVYGTVSAGGRNCNFGDLTVFTRVSAFTNWIRSIIGY